MPDLFFPDTSNFQESIDFHALRGYTPVNVEQISWGTAVTLLPGRMAAIRSAGFTVTVWYLGLVANQNIAAQVAAFTGQLPELGPTDALFIDWEDTPNTLAMRFPPNLPRSPAAIRRIGRFVDGATPTAGQRDQAAQLLAAHYGCAESFIGVYGSPGNLAAAPPPGWAIVASYETSEPAVAHTAWQFTDGVYVSNPYGPINFPGIGFCDASVFHGTVEQFDEIVVPFSGPKPQPSSESQAMSLSVPVVWFDTTNVVQVSHEGPVDQPGAIPTGQAWLKRTLANGEEQNFNLTAEAFGPGATQDYICSQPQVYVSPPGAADAGNLIVLLELPLANNGSGRVRKFMQALGNPWSANDLG